MKRKGIKGQEKNILAMHWQKPFKYVLYFWVDQIPDLLGESMFGCTMESKSKLKKIQRREVVNEKAAWQRLHSADMHRT